MTSPSACVACGASGSFEPALDTLARCRACGFVTWPGAEQVDSNTLYDERYFTDVDYPDYVGNEPSLRRSMARHLEQMSHFGAHRGALLEIGCAYGYFLDEARRHYDRVAGVDVAAAAVERARARFGVEAHAGSFLDIPFEDSSFDVVCMWDTVEHLPRPDRFIERARRLLRPDGRLFLTTGDISSLNARVRGANWRQIHPPSHVHYFSRRTIATLLERLGFRCSASRPPVLPLDLQRPGVHIAAEGPSGRPQPECASIAGRALHAPDGTVDQSRRHHVRRRGAHRRAGESDSGQPVTPIFRHVTVWR